MAKNSVSNNGKPRKSIDDMNLAEITAYNIELLAKLKRLLAEGALLAHPQVQSDPWKAYTGSDGSRHGLDGAFVEE